MKRGCVVERVLVVIAVMVMISVAEEENVKAGESRAEVFRAAVGETDRLTIDPSDVWEGEIGHRGTHTIKGKAEISELLGGLDFDEELSGRSCACSGDRLIRLYKKERLVASLGHQHGTALRWADRRWEGDSAFTPEAAAHWRAWFREHGYPLFHDEHVAEMKHKAMEERIRTDFLSHFPEDVRPAFTTRTEDMYVDRDWSELKPEVRRELLARLRGSFDSEAALTVALCRAFGEQNVEGNWIGGSWGTAEPYTFLGRWAAEELSPAEFGRVVEQMDDTRELLGAAGFFFQWNLGSRMEEPVRKRLSAKLGEVTFRHDRCGNAALAFRMMNWVVAPEVDKVLLDVVHGRLVVPRSPHALGEQLDSRVVACLTLTLHGHEGMAEMASRMLEEVEKGSDDAVALKLALYHLGDAEMWPEGVFKIWSGFLGESAMVILAKQGDKAALHRLITEATEHPHAAVREQSVLVIERLTGKKWFKGEENERAEWHCEDIREWWAEAGKTWEGKAGEEE